MANIFVAIPQYKKMPDAEINRIAEALDLKGWKPRLEGFHPMFDISIDNLCNSGHTIRLCIIEGDGNLPRVRSYQAGVFRHEYEDPDCVGCDYFLIVDEDISFLPKAIDHMIEDDKPIVGGIYTFKTDNPKYTGKPCSRFYPGISGSMEEPFKVQWINGGFVMIEAKTLLAMMDHYYDELAFKVPVDNGLNITESVALWCPKVHICDGEGFFLSEDWAFSQRAHDIGLDVWADWRCDLWHWKREYGYHLSLQPENEINETERSA